MKDAASTKGGREVLLVAILALAVAFGAASAREEAVANARALLEKGDDAGALREAKEILLDDPRNVGALYVAGLASLGLDRLNDAERYLEKATRVAPEAPNLEYQLGVVLARIADDYQGRGKKRIASGLYDEALEHFEKELARSPGHVEAIAARASTYLKSGKTQDATDALEQWIATNPDSVDGYVALVRLYTSESRPDDAREVLARMPATEPKQRAEATFLVARTYYLQDRATEGRPLLDELRALPAEPWQLSALEALDHLSAGKAHEASSSLIAFVDMDPPLVEVELVAAAYHDLFSQLRRTAAGENREEQRDAWPKLTMRTSPKYPEDARRYGVEGKVLLLAVVEEDGSVGRLLVISATATRHESLYRPQFEQAALDAVRQWRYEPARRDGKPEAFPITISIGFTHQ
jgi:TonB family protein